MSSTSHKVRRAVAGDEPILRKLRLQAFADAPGGFGSTYEREHARTTADWQRWLAPGVSFLWNDADDPCAMVAGVRDAADASVATLRLPRGGSSGGTGGDGADGEGAGMNG